MYQSCFYIRTKSLGNNSKSQIFVTFIAEYLPEMITGVMSYLPTKKYRYIKQTRDTITAIASEVITEKQNDIKNGLDGGKDLMSLLLRANAREDKQRRMSHEELIAGIM
jgi:cytochrome P450